ncbi:hypothetical protein [Actinoplanes teichomyceticus]|uniref:Uncharacterized protein n=1 Tax=Actinoplanes teichomyceticus TaxID=1867 RepID=A0A561VS07_ACTTI|nr:hypothetical protein [Actinoplanes teichomyceticus]TWG14409.1 hypothetical protein FHX34_104709 [Actinoplanes teichomyceticus]GIF13029.1 hypothetical protein Ate01nite_30610 [Actinoplanes teichomyceticus]
MGSGRWSTDVYTAAANYRAATGPSAFAHGDGGARRAHPALDPAGVFMRESRDSAEHPASTPIVVMFDVTGATRAVPRALQARLPRLLGLLTGPGGVTDPQLMFGAIGDATRDPAPLQVGQFESDNRMDQDLSRILPRGGPGAGRRASYELAMYFLARHVVLDSLIERRRKGYLFLVGDRMPGEYVQPAQVRRVIGDELAQPVPTRAILTELQRKFEVFFIRPGGAGHGADPAVLAAWRDLLPQHVLELEDVAEICETVARAVRTDAETPELSLALRRP